MDTGKYHGIPGGTPQQFGSSMIETHGARIHITGIVQGVGFRPFVYGLARSLELVGWVRNTSAGVDIEVDGAQPVLQIFTNRLRTEAPALARIDTLDVQACTPHGYTAFEIVNSQPLDGAFQPISPDVSICTDCLRELFDPADRRYRYPFINCTNCGPRFTIIRDIPYDRPKTTMADFEMCPACQAEYNDPLNRRFHAQPVACPHCGPSVWLEDGDQHTAAKQQVGEEAIRNVQDLLHQGKLVAIKGLGGFHLACDALNPTAVAELRRRKLRVDKPFALMMPDLETVEQYCILNAAEKELLESSARPIVILKRKPHSQVAESVSPYQDTMGVMLPYTPLHYLLFASMPEDNLAAPKLTALVMTSGNLCEEPIVTSNQAARQQLAGLADAFLMHDRDIYVRCDDSVMRVVAPPNPSGASQECSSLPVRRSRGYSPYPVRLPWEVQAVLATGAEMKNTFCLARDRYAFLSHHIGDLENYETLCSFEQGIAHFEQLFRIHPAALAYDLHPNYLATRYAQERAEREHLPAVGVQHHHAHVAACMVEHGLHGDHPVIGVAFDGTGYGEDGAIWGGEFLVADYSGYQRPFHLAYVPLPGGDAAIRKPSRTALAYLYQAGLDWADSLECVTALSAPEKLALRAQLENGLNSPPTSSMGRLFDAVSALIGVRQSVNYEGQAAIELEALAHPDEYKAYAFDLESSVTGEGLVNPLGMVRAILSDRLAGVPAGQISARFHNSVAEMVGQVCNQIRQENGIGIVVLSGGVWQNITLLQKTLAILKRDSFTIYTHCLVPPNDGGLALGQAVIGLTRLGLNKG